jgi:hypothetical protein
MATSADRNTPVLTDSETRDYYMWLGANLEREEIARTVRTHGYDWSHDPRMSGLQHLLNWMEARSE